MARERKGVFPFRRIPGLGLELWIRRSGVEPAKGLGREWARERKGQETKVLGSELARVLLADSLLGANWPGSEKAVN